MNERTRPDMQKPSNGQLGTFAGVFTPSILTILGIVLFLRLGYIVGSNGLVRALLIIAMANAISILTSFSLAAIATNFEVKGGGDYFLISRTLGLGFGAAIGIILFLAQSVSIGFYCIGMAEAFVAMIPLTNPAAVPAIAALAVALLGVFAWFGTDWATRFQYVIMALLVLALASFAVGAMSDWNLDTFEKNLAPPEQVPGFWVAFAVFFPAVTGFTQGVSMSGELRDPGNSIPTGTFLAVSVSIAVYVGVALLLAGALPNARLATDYGVMTAIAAAGWLVGLGVLAATLSSALASFLGAPRILQALARDRVLPLLHPFAKGAGATGNPRRGVLLSGAIALGIVIMGDLNAIASVVSMFFLASYGLVNYATYYEAGTASPHFRPTFRWYKRPVSLAGMLACLGVMLAIDFTSALAAIAILAAIYRYLGREGVRVRWADSRRANDLQEVRRHLLSARRENEHPRDWRPFILAFSDDAHRRQKLLRFASWIEGGSGLTTVVHIVIGQGSAAIEERGRAMAEMAKEARSGGFDVFPLVVSAASFNAAVPVLIQSAGIGPVRANTVLVNWLEGDTALVSQWTDTDYGHNLRTAFRLGCNLVILDADDTEWNSLRDVPARSRVIDIWWTTEATGRLTLLLAYLMTRSDEWRGGSIRVLISSGGRESENYREAMQEMLDSARIEAELTLVEGGDSEAIVEHSARSALIFMPLEIRAGRQYDPFGNDLKLILKRLPVVVMVMAAQNVELDAQPDDGKAAEDAALLDRLDDAKALESGFVKETGAAAKAEASAEAALDEASRDVRDSKNIERLHQELEAARDRSRSAAQDLQRATNERQRISRLAEPRGLVTPNDRNRSGDDPVS